MTEGLRTYGAEWVRNEGAFGVLNAFVPQARLVSAGIVVAGFGYWPASSGNVSGPAWAYGLREEHQRRGRERSP